MGIVAKQTAWNTFSTYLGFVIGALNVYQYTYILGQQGYGTISYVLAVANFVLPVLTFGTQSTLIRYFPRLQRQQEKSHFLFWMLALPLFGLLPLGLVLLVFPNLVLSLLDDSMTGTYLLYLWVLILFMVYFELFYSWAKLQLRSTWGTVLKEIGIRAGISLILGLYWLADMGFSNFLLSLVVVYGLMTFVIGYGVIRKTPVKVRIGPLPLRKDILKYSITIVVSGVSAAAIVNLDRLIVPEFLDIKMVAIYSIPVFLASVVAIPSRAMMQIVHPITSKQFAEGNMPNMDMLYKKTSLNLALAAGFIWLLVLCNAHSYYQTLPKEDYSKGFLVLLMLSLARWFDSLIGNNNSILTNSQYYSLIVWLNALMAISVLSLCILFIPIWGINGAAFAVLISVVLINGFKVYAVWNKFRLFPFSWNTVKIFLLIGLCFLLFFSWDFMLHPFLNIILKSIIIGITYLSISYLLGLTDDYKELIKTLFKG